ncbi:PREDICTED: protein AHNAK2 [Chrysochloris asiatica]|uniref:Protein AHNAK2 n=1 Tax=Chrysochloris asiatica TaxID=185453 RepID=A0A9B0TC67_CHRAS|nr:PREDICTED: protein AHNAK2 [Chrysochloris asiatica]
MVSGRQLQPEEHDAETEEDHSVTEGPLDEIIRPRPQGSSPVYECATEAFGLPEDAPGRRVSSGRRRSWWKRDSGDTRTFSRMSRPEVGQGGGPTEVTLKTEVEVGASGYSVTGGGDQGIFVKQVLKESSAAKLFSLREGDQLLSATIFFDDIKYEDALKILQYSEPYKVQFRVKRRLPDREDDKGAHSGTQLSPKGPEKQDKEVTDRRSESPTKTLEGGGDQDRLLPKAREGRGRKPQKERLSWPKFQAIRPKYRPGPRRSHSSSEAYDRAAPDVSPTSTDTEVQLPAEEQELQSGQRRRRFLSLRFRTGSGRPGKEAQGRPVPRVKEEAEFWSTGVSLSKEAPGFEDKVPGPATRRKKKIKEAKVQGELAWKRGPQDSLAPEQALEDNGDAVRGLEIGIAKLSLQDTTPSSDTQSDLPEIRVRIPHLKTPCFGVSKQKVLDTDTGISEPQLEQWPGMPSGVGPGLRVELEGGARAPQEDLPGHGDQQTYEQTVGQSGDKVRAEEKEAEGSEGKLKMPKFKMPSFGWSPSKESKTPETKQSQETRGDQVIAGTARLPARANRTETEQEHYDQEKRTDIKLPGTSLEEDMSLADKGVVTRDSKFKMPGFKMPSFGVILTSKEVTPSVDESLPRVGVEINLPTVEGNADITEIKANMPSREVALKTRTISMKIPESEVSAEKATIQLERGGLKEEVPKVQMADIQKPKVDLKGNKMDVSFPDVDVSLPKVSVDVSVPRLSVDEVKLEGDVKLRDKDIKTKDSKFKMPSFKMPSFGVSVPSKSRDGSVDVSLSEAQVDVFLPSVEDEVKTSDVNIQLPLATIDAKGGEVDVKIPEGQLPEGEFLGQAVGTGLKGHLPKFQKPSVKMPKVDFKAPHMDIKGPKVDMKGLKGEVATPDMEVPLPSVEVDIQALGAKLEGDLSLGDKDLATKDSKFKMPKFKMPSFGVSTPRKDLGTSVDLPKVDAEVSLSSMGVELEPAEGSILVPSADISLPGTELDTGELKGKGDGVRIKGHLPKVQMPSIKMPKVDLKGSKVDTNLPHVDVSLPKDSVESQATRLSVEGVKLEGDLKLGDKDVKTKDSKFKMPSFKMPSFGVSVPSKSIDASVDMCLPEVQVPSVVGEVKTNTFRIQHDSANIDLKSGEVGEKLPEGELAGEVMGVRLKENLPKVQMPKVDFKGPKVDLKGSKVDVKDLKGEVAIPDMEMSLSSVEVDIQATGTKVENDVCLGDKDLATKDSKFKMPKFQMPSVKMPKVDLKTSQVDIKGPKLDLKGLEVDVKGLKGEMATPDVEVSLPSKGMDIQVPGTKLESDVLLGNKDLATKDSKFKMSSFGVSTPSKDLGTSVDLPKVRVDEPTEGSIPVPSADISLPEAKLDASPPEVELSTGELKDKDEGIRNKGHLPKVQMPGIKMSKVDLKGPKVDASLPDVEVSLPKVSMDAPTPEFSVEGGKLEGDLKLRDKDVKTKDSKFKMPSFKMPSFGVSMPSKSIKSSVDLSLPEAQVDMSVPSVKGGVKTSDTSIQLPSTKVDVKAGEVGVKLPEDQLSKEELKEQAVGTGLKGHLPKFQMPSVKMPKVDFKTHQTDIKEPKVDLKVPKVDVTVHKGEVAISDVELSLPSVEVDTQVPGTKLERVKLEGDVNLGDKDVKTKDSKFKTSSFKIPSFGMSTSSKSIKGSMDVSLPEAQLDVSLPSVEGDVKTGVLNIQLPSADVDIEGGEVGMKLPDDILPEEKLAEQSMGAGLTGHLPKIQMSHVKMPTVDFKTPQMDIKGTKVDIQGLKGEVATPDVEVSLHSMDVDIHVPGTKVEGDVSLGEKDLAVKGSRFKMLSFKMPSFGVLEASKSTEGFLDVSLPEPQLDVSLSSIEGGVKTDDLSIQLPSADVDIKGGKVGMVLPEGQLSKEEIAGQVTGAGFKGYLPTFQKPKVDFKIPQVDIKGPKVDRKALKGETASSNVEVSLPSMSVDIQRPGAKLEGDMTLEEQDLTTKDSKFKMPKFKMPSFGVSTPSKDLGTSVDLPKVSVEASLSSMAAELPPTEGSIPVPSADISLPGAELDLSLPEVELAAGELKGKSEGIRIKGHLPKVQMPSIKMPKVDLKGPKVDASLPDMDMSLPKVSVETLASGLSVEGVKLEGDIKQGDKDKTHDSKFKMPSFKMPSFGISAPSKSIKGSMDVSLPQAQMDLSLPSVEGEVMTSDLSIKLPSADMDMKGGELDVKLPGGQLTEEELAEQAVEVGLKGNLPKFQMSSVKLPKMDFKTPQVDIKVPKVNMKGLKGEVAAPDVNVSLSSVDVDIQAPGTKMEGDMSLGDKDLATKDSKFKIPSFGVSSLSKDLGASMPKLCPEASESSVGGDLPPSEGSIPLPSADTSLSLPGTDLDVSLPEVKLAASELKDKGEGVGIKGYLPRVQMPGIKMPKVDLKDPKVDASVTNVDMSLPKGSVDVLVSKLSVEEVKLEEDVKLGDKDIKTKDSKFKMPSFKMPSFGVSEPSKSIKGSVDVSLPETHVDMSPPSVEEKVRTGDLRIQLPSANMDMEGGELSVRLPEGQLPKEEQSEQAMGEELKGHQSKFQMPSVKIPKVDIKFPKVDIKDPKGEVVTSDVEMSLPRGDVDIQVLGTKLEGDLSLEEKCLDTKDSKFKRPSFGVSTPSKDLETSMHFPKVDSKASESSVGMVLAPSKTSITLHATDPDMSLPEVQLAAGGLKGKDEGIRITGRLPKVQMPSIKMPKVDVKAPEVDIKGSKVDVKGLKGEVATPDVEVSLPSMEMDIQVPGAKLEGDMSQEDKDLAIKDSKFKMPKFKMPSFGLSAPSKDLGNSMDLTNVGVDAALPSVGGELTPTEASIRVPSADITLPGAELAVSLPKVEQSSGELKVKDEDVKIKGHLPKDSKFKMPKLKMPSFGVSTPSKDLGTSVNLPTVSMEASLSSGEEELTPTEANIPLPSADVSLPGADPDMSLPEVELATGELKGKGKGITIKGHLPKVQMPGIKMPKVDKKGPKVDTSLPGVDVSLPKVSMDAPTHGISMEGVKLEEVRLEGKDVKTKDGKFKVPSFKMPSLGVSSPSKSIKGSVDVSLPEAQMDVSLPSIEGGVKTGDINIQLPSADGDGKSAKVGLKIPKGQLSEEGLVGQALEAEHKSHLPKSHIPHVKMPKVDFKTPQVDIKGLKVDAKEPGREVDTPDVEVSLPSVEVVEGDVLLGDKDFAAKDSKFKMPKFKMPSFGVSAPSKDLVTSMDLPKDDVQASLPSVGVELTPAGVSSADSISLPGAELDISLPELELTVGELKGKDEGIKIKGHLPKVQMPSIKMPKVGVRGPRVDASIPDVDVSLPKVSVDASVPGLSVDEVKLEGDTKLGDKDIKIKDSKFKMPSFKMPSFGVSVPTHGISMEGVKLEEDVRLEGKDVKTKDGKFKVPSFKMPSFGMSSSSKSINGSVDVSLPEAQMDVSLPSIEGGVKTGDKIPKVDIKAPQVDIKGPEVDLKGSKLDVKGLKGDVATPDDEVSLPSVEVDIQVSGAKLEGDMSLGDKDLATKDSKFKMPKFKMPSFSVSAPSKDLVTSMDLPKEGVEASLPSVGVELTPARVSSADISLPGAELDMSLPELELTVGELKGKDKGIKIKEHLPKVQMPKLGVRGPKVDASLPDVDVSLPKVTMDTSVPGLSVDEMNKFKMPKFKMPSFGLSAPSKDLGTSMDLPNVGVDASLPSVGGELTPTEASIRVPSADITLPGAELAVSLPKVEQSSGELKVKDEDVKIKGHLPKVQMPGVKMAKVDLKTPQMDNKDTKLDMKCLQGEGTTPDMEMSLPSVEVDIQVPGAKVECDMSLGDKDLDTKDSKFKMPKLKMPSFGVSTPSKDLGTSVNLPTVSMEASLSSVEVELTPTEGSVPVQMPGIKMPKVDLKGPKVDTSLPGVDVSLPKVSMNEPAHGISMEGVKLEEDVRLEGKDVKTKDGKFKMPSFKMPSFGRSSPSKSISGSVDVSLPEAQMDVSLPSIGGGVKTGDKIPKVDIKAPQVDIKGPKVDLKGSKLDVKGLKGEVATPDVEVSLPSMEVDIQVSGAKLQGDMSLGDKDLATKDSKFKMPKFKMPSFGLTPTEASIRVPSADITLPGAELAVSLPEVETSGGELTGNVKDLTMKGHLPKFQMSGTKMPKLDLKFPQGDIDGSQMEENSLKGDVVFSGCDVPLPSTDIDIQQLDCKAEGDVSLGDKDVALKDSQFRMPRLSKLSFTKSSRVSTPSSQIEGSVKGPESVVSTATGDTDLLASGPDFPDPCVDISVALPADKDGEKSRARESHFKMPKVFCPSMKTSTGHVALFQDSGEPVSLHVAAASPDITAGLSQGEIVASDVQSPLVPKVGLPDVQSTKVYLRALLSGSSMSSPSDGVTLTKHQAPLPVDTMCAGTVPVSAPDVPLRSQDNSAPQMETPLDPVGSLSPTTYRRVTFPKFHKPRFVFSVETTSVPEDRGLVAEELESPPPPNTTLPPAESPAATGLEDQPGPGATAAMGLGEATPDDSEREGKGSPFRMPRFKLPSLSRSPKKGAGPQADLESSSAHAELSLGSDGGQFGAQTGVHTPQVEADADVTPEKDGAKGRMRKSSFAMPKLSFSKGKGSKGGSDQPQTDAQPSLSGTPEALGKTSGGGGTAGRALDGLSEPQVQVRPSEHDLALRESGAGHGPVDSPAHPPHRDGTAPPTVEVLSPAGAPLGTDTHRVESHEGDAQVPKETVGSQEGWFRVPKFRMPGFWRASTKEKGGSTAQVTQGPRPQGAGEAAGTLTQEAHVQEWRTLEAAVSPQPTEAKADGSTLETESYADVLKRNIPDPGLKLSSPAARTTTTDRPSEGSLPLRMPSERPPEGQAPQRETDETSPPGPGARGPPSVEGQAEVPLKLKTLLTQMPAQVSLVQMDRVWEDSVVTVTFPKLKVPRFTIRAPSRDVDIFVPSVREEPCPRMGTEATLHGESPGAWVASILKTGAGIPSEQPEGTVSPISKVRVHIQGVHVETQAVTISSEVTPGSTEPPAPEAFSTQIVRESRVPASDIQTPSYGFSLLKVKVPEPHTESTPSSQEGEGSGEAPQQVAPGTDPVSADLQPDTEEPFEIISSSVSMLRPQASQSKAHGDLQYADSYSDEEPAEILEFPSEDSQEVTALPTDEDRNQKEKSASKKPGLFRFWLPNIGFSSAVEEPSSDPKDDAQESVPIQTQPEAPSETELPKKQEKAGWFRFPKLGFSSSPAKKRESMEVETQPTEQEEAAIFFDARESLSPEDKEEGEPADGQGSRGKTAPAERTEAMQLEKQVSGESTPRPATK